MYKVSIIVLCAAFSACLFSACRSGLQSDENSLVQVGDEILSRQELADAMPEGLSLADSTDLPTSISVDGFVMYYYIEWHKRIFPI